MKKILGRLLNLGSALVLLSWDDPPAAPGELPYIIAFCLVTDQAFEPSQLTARAIAELRPISCPFCNSTHGPCEYISGTRVGWSLEDFGQIRPREVPAN